jgi:hypothetical protein
MGSKNPINCPLAASNLTRIRQQLLRAADSVM